MKGLWGSQRCDGLPDVQLGFELACKAEHCVYGGCEPCLLVCAVEGADGADEDSSSRDLSQIVEPAYICPSCQCQRGAAYARGGDDSPSGEGTDPRLEPGGEG